jgi:hypothetical protein
MKAISFNNYDCVKLLLRFGGDPTIANNVIINFFFKNIINKNFFRHFSRLFINL